MVDFALVINELDNIIINNYHRKMATYLELGWDKKSIHEYITKKENMGGRIASFNTPTVSFTASSRRNRFYEIYNRNDMLEKDQLYPKVIEAMNTLSKYFQIFVISTRTEDLMEKTLDVLKNLDFPLEKVTIYFKKQHEPIQSYKRRCILDIKAKYLSGVAIILNPQDAQLFQTFEYTPIGFTTLKDEQDFVGVVDVVCHDWNQVIDALDQSKNSKD
ncbi:MAG: hypothetical protein ACTSU2_13765 [Promethearchaeota archaeon]